MTYRFGDVVVVPFPYTDMTRSKVRPAVVVSSDAYNETRPDVVLAAITSRQHAGPFGTVPISNWQGVRLGTASFLKPVFCTFMPSIVRNKLGRLDASDMESLRLMLSRALG